MFNIEFLTLKFSSKMYFSCFVVFSIYRYLYRSNPCVPFLCHWNPTFSLKLGSSLFCTVVNWPIRLKSSTISPTIISDSKNSVLKRLRSIKWNVEYFQKWFTISTFMVYIYSVLKSRISGEMPLEKVKFSRHFTLLTLIYDQIMAICSLTNTQWAVRYWNSLSNEVLLLVHHGKVKFSDIIVKCIF